MASIAMMALLTFMSCEDDKAQYHAPVYKAITFSPNPCYPGDEVTATITYSNKGENWYYFKQTFVLDGETILQRTKSSTSTTIRAVLDSFLGCFSGASSYASSYSSS